MSSATAHSSSTGSSPSASKPSSRCKVRTASPFIQADASWNTSNRATFATASSASATLIMLPLGCSKANLSISCLAASRLPSTRSANSVKASASMSNPAFFRRPLIQAGSVLPETALASNTTPCRAIAANHLACVCAFSSLGSMTTVTVSSGRFSARLSNASPPFFPGLPFGI